MKKWFYIFLLSSIAFFSNGQERREIHVTRHVLTIGYQPSFQFTDDDPRVGEALHGLNVGYLYENNFSKYTDAVNWGLGIRYASLGRSDDSAAHRILHTISIPFQVDVRIFEGYKGFIFGGLNSFFKVNEYFTGPEDDSIRREGPSYFYDMIPYLGFLYKSDRYRWGLQAGKGLIPQPYGNHHEYYLFHFGYHL